jgi:hypothetical protein
MKSAMVQEPTRQFVGSKRPAMGDCGSDDSGSEVGGGVAVEPRPGKLHAERLKTKMTTVRMRNRIFVPIKTSTLNK